MQAVTEFSLKLETGEIFGIAGPNGAGKSTLISMLLGFLQPTTGRITVDGLAPRKWVETRGAGYLSELVAIPPAWTVEGALLRFAVLAQVPPAARRERIEHFITLLGLEEHRRKRVKQLSKGNLQRLGLAQALLSESDLIILDEPTHGFDPLWTQRFRDIGRGLKRPGRTVVIASHNLDELERVADRVGIIDQGRLQDIAVIGARDSATLAPYRLVVALASLEVAAAFPGAILVGDGRENEYSIPEIGLEELNRGLARLIGAGVQIVAVVPERSTLEAAFRQAVGAGS